VPIVADTENQADDAVHQINVDYEVLPFVSTLKEVMAPRYLVDIKKIDNLRYIKEDAQGGVRIGALTKLSEMVESEILARKYPMLVRQTA
jgi:CO/xanthine dehydrogenase Mo-binding subunit